MMLNVLRLRSAGLPIEVYILSVAVDRCPWSARHGRDAVTFSPTSRLCKTLFERVCQPSFARAEKAATAGCMPGTGSRLVCKMS